MSQQFEFKEVQDNDLNHQMIVERCREIKEIEKQMGELNEIFRDFHALVVDQTDVIENIEHNISNSLKYTDKGVEEIQEARNKQINGACTIF